MVAGLSDDSFVAREQSNARYLFQPFFQSRSVPLAQLGLIVQSLQLGEQDCRLKFSHPVIMAENRLAFRLFARRSPAVGQTDDLVGEADVTGYHNAAFSRGH